MDKFLKRKPQTQEPCGDKRSRVDLNNLSSDPGLRQKISEYHPNDREAIRRAYLQKGPCQPFNHKFPQRDISGELLFKCLFDPTYNNFWSRHCVHWSSWGI